MKRIDPQLVAALKYYAQGRYNPMEPSLYVHTDRYGRQYAWSLEKACGDALEALKTFQRENRQYEHAGPVRGKAI